MEKQKIDKNYIDQLKTMRMYEIVIVENNAQMQRVPGGWVYQFYHAWSENEMEGSSCCFIPLSNDDPLMGEKNDPR